MGSGGETCGKEFCECGNEPWGFMQYLPQVLRLPIIEKIKKCYDDPY